MAYEKLMGSRHPGLILILIDQSGSMVEEYGGSTKAVVAAQAVNRVVNEIVEASQAGESIKDRCYVGIIGYGMKTSPGVKPLLGGMISKVANNPIDVVEVDRQVQDGAGGLVTVKQRMPIWIEPVADWGTPMEKAFAMARPLVEEWVQNHPDSFPPVVINISDGEPNDMLSARVEAERLMEVASNDGRLLIFNAHISSSNAAEIRLPNTAAGLHDEFARFLFEISSPLPDRLLSEATKAGFAPLPGARGFIFNAAAETLIKLLTFGTVGTMGNATQLQRMR